MAHHTLKHLYGLTNKQDPSGQVVSWYHRECHFSSTESNNPTLTLTDGYGHNGCNDSPELHHTITNSRNYPVSLSSFSSTSDPATKVSLEFLRAKFASLHNTQNFTCKLRIHLLSRLLRKGLNGDDPGSFTNDERNSLWIINNTIFLAKQFSVNYTTYDVHRDQDIINPRCHPYVMVQSPKVGDNTHPYWYAQVLRIYHTVVSMTHPAATMHSAQVMQFLWVRWLGTKPGHCSSPQVARSPRIGFVEAMDEDVFGFLDPELIIQGSHLIPTFHFGQTHNLMPYNGPTAAHLVDENDDWLNFYINMYAFFTITSS